MCNVGGLVPRRVKSSLHLCVVVFVVATAARRTSLGGLTATGRGEGRIAVPQATQHNHWYVWLTVRETIVAHKCRVWHRVW